MDFSPFSMVAVEQRISKFLQWKYLDRRAAGPAQPDAPS
jgi:hypothetical protein